MLTSSSRVKLRTSYVLLAEVIYVTVCIGIEVKTD